MMFLLVNQTLITFEFFMLLVLASKVKNPLATRVLCVQLKFGGASEIKDSAALGDIVSRFFFLE